MSGPQDSRSGGNGIRIYTWEEPGEEPIEVISVTSIRKMTGIPMSLMNWMLANVVNLTTGMRQVTVVGPRGGISKKYVKDGPFPGEFAVRLTSTGGVQAELEELRRWVRENADEPRDIAAMRGTVIHKLIEKNYPMSKINDILITTFVRDQWRQERRKVKPDVTDQDVLFIKNAMRQYWHMRGQKPFVILAQEPQVWNLTAGYAGSADVFLWFMPEGSDLTYWQDQADRGAVHLSDIESIGGSVELGDWKTSESIHVDNAVQVTAYAASEFVGSNGVRDRRLTEILNAMGRAAIIHIRPDKCEIDRFPFRDDILDAFLGTVVFARFCAMHQNLNEIVDEHMEFRAPDTEESTDE